MALDSVLHTPAERIGCRHGFRPANVSEDDRNDASIICLGDGGETGQSDSLELRVLLPLWIFVWHFHVLHFQSTLSELRLASLVTTVWKYRGGAGLQLQ